MSDSTLAPLVLDGWFVLHQFVRVPSSTERFDDPSSADSLGELAGLLAEWEHPDDDGWSGVYRIIGGGADYMLVHFRSDLEELGKVERQLRMHPGWAELAVTHDYLSVVELGLYHATMTLLAEAAEDGVEVGTPEWDERVQAQLGQEREKRYVQSRLRPVQPTEMPWVCVYPMDKRRSPGQNWYALPLEERAAMMAEHGTVGRRYAGRISQVISGSVGFDDWEWAVTLFAGDPLDFKSLITEMRYDRASAEFADFGPFWTGHRVAADDLAEEWGIS